MLNSQEKGVDAAAVEPDLRTSYVSCLRALLRPVLKFCLRHSLKIQEIVDACKIELLAAAEDEIRRSGRALSASRLSVMTGMHRPDIKRLYKTRGAELPAENLIVRLIGQWQHDPRFLGRNRKPKVLSCEGRGSEFFELVESLSAALNPYTILFEMERLGAVQRSPEGARLLSEQHIIRGNLTESFVLASRNMEDLVWAVEQNILAPASPLNLHLVTEFDKVAPEHESQIRTWLLNQGSAFHKRARHFLAKFDRDVNRKITGDTPSLRIALCAFSSVCPSAAAGPNFTAPPEERGGRAAAPAAG